MPIPHVILDNLDDGVEFGYGVSALSFVALDFLDGIELGRESIEDHDINDFFDRHLVCGNLANEVCTS